MPPAPPLVLDTVEKVRKLRDAVAADEDPSMVLSKARALLDQSGAALNESLQHAIYRIYTDALIHQGQFERVLQICQDKNKVDKAIATQCLAAVHPYALYRLDRLEEAHKVATQTLQEQKTQLSDTDKQTLEHVVAQCHYRLGKMAEACQSYNTALMHNHQDTQVATNLVATHVANATPFVADNHSDENLQKIIAENNSNTLPYDLAYNLATLDILAGKETTNKALPKALEQAKRETSDWPQADATKELAPLRMNMDWARVFWQGGSTESNIPMKDLAPSAKLVALVNRALDMAKPTDGLRLLPTDTSKLTPLQARLLIYNRAILQYKAQQWDECMETCRLLMSSLKETKTHSKIETQWWEARATVVQVRAQLQKGGSKYNKNTAEQTLKGLLQTLEKQPESSIRDDAVAYIQCHLPSILQQQDSTTPQARIALLKSLPASWQSKPAVVATLAALYQQEGESARAMELVQTTGHQDALADLLLSQGLYQEAVDLYKKAGLTDPIAQARYARALTFGSDDPSQALDYWKQVRPTDVLDGNADNVDGAELETRPVPRLRVTSPRRAVTEAAASHNENSGGTQKQRKSHDAVLRRRARKRDEYLAELDRRGLRRTAHPDPERWLPKYERSYNRRRRNKNVHKGAQGGVSDKDAAQLDVAARQAARAAGDTGSSSTSTAHIAAVSTGGPRKGGRRR